MEPEKLYLEIINNLSDGVYLVDQTRTIIFWNKAAEEITGYSKEEVIGKHCQDNILNHIDKEGHPLCTLGCPLYATIIDGHQRRAEVFLRHKEGHRIPIMVNIFPILEENEAIGAIEIFTPNSPIVYENDLIERLSNLAMNDQLTGLANRRKLESYLEYKLRELKRFQNKFCVLFLDVDNFGAFNNTYGHDAGDEVLKTVAATLKRNMRKNDLLGRWGGEEFVGIFEIKNGYESTLLAEKIRVLIAGSEISHEGAQLSVTASLGVTLARDGDSIDVVIRRADDLMYLSKKKGKNCVSSDL